MSNTKKIFEISLTSLSQNGISCKNIEIDWEKPSCANVKCEFDGKTIKVTVPEGCEGECIYAVVRCKDNNCSDCPASERIKICPCVSNADCDDCEECIDNLCVSKCPGGKFCDNDRCVDCDEDHPCPCNQVCVAGDCQCPPNKPLINDKGCCTECLDDSDCPPCTICTPDGCIPIDCPDGACDPETEKCVGCVDSGNCEGSEVCIDNKCECPPGLIRNVVTKECEPTPECEIDKDCNLCEICVDGKCVPLVCPQGFVCVDGECKKECDCLLDDCDKGSTCVKLTDTICYCNDCGDPDINGDCPEGCYNKDGNCVPNPCKGSCVNGTNCGSGCGCLNGKCVPCDSLTCDGEDCTEALGCICENNECKDAVGCNGTCATSDDCGENCVCINGECNSCDDFPQGSVDCNDGGGVGDCEDNIRIEKLEDSCDIKGILELQQNCSCPVIQISGNGNMVIDSGNLKIDTIFQLRKGLANNSPMLGDTSHPDIADNEKPLIGSFKVISKLYVKDYDEDGIYRGDVLESIDETTISLSNKDENNGNISVDFDRELSYVIVQVYQNTFQFDNSCTYDGTNLIFSKKMYNTIPFNFMESMKSNDSRDPFIRWFRGKSGTYDVSPFKKRYIPEVSQGVYHDVLYDWQDGLYSSYDYRFESDCGCDKVAELSRVVFCKPTQFPYELSDCNKKVVLNAFTSCDVNADLRRTSAPNDAQVKWKLYIDGKYILEAQQDEGGPMLITDGDVGDLRDYTYEQEHPITSIEWVHNHDSSCVMSADILDVLRPDFNYSTSCFSGDNFELTMDQMQSGEEVVKLYTENSIGYLTNGEFRLILSKKERHTVFVELSSGCIFDFNIYEDCCNELDGVISYTIQSLEDDKMLEFTGQILNSTTPIFLEIFTPTSTISKGLEGTYFNETIDNPISGTYIIKVTDFNDCVFSYEVVINIPEDLYLEIIPTNLTLCEGESGDMILQGGAGTSGAEVTYNYNGTQYDVVLDTNGKFIIQGLSTDGVVNVTKIVDTSNNVTVLSKSGTITVSSNYFASIETAHKTICLGDSVDLELSGSPNTVIILSNGGEVLLDQNGEGVYSFSPTVTQVLTIGSIKDANCETTLSGISTISVVSPNQIVLLSNECSTDLTSRNLLFNHITSLVYTSTNVNIPLVNNSATVDDNTSITATFDNGTCVTTQEFILSDCECDITSSVNDEIICSGEDVTLLATHSSQNLVNYLWSTGESTPSITLQNVSNSQIVSVTVVDTVTNCSSTSSGTVTVNTGVNPVFSDANINSIGQDQWEAEHDDSSRFIYNGQGTVVWRNLDDNTIFDTNNVWWVDTSTVGDVFNFRLEITYNGCTTYSDPQTIEIICVDENLSLSVNENLPNVFAELVGNFNSDDTVWNISHDNDGIQGIVFTNPNLGQQQGATINEQNDIGFTIDGGPGVVTIEVSSKTFCGTTFSETYTITI